MARFARFSGASPANGNVCGRFHCGQDSQDDKPPFDRLPRGATVTDVGRGGHLVQEDLLQALDDGTLSCAMLDICEPEPLL